uniref:Secreted protein n=1 Tax=Salix viminalis TaxID=40686 RepID=A0A6N2MSU2_SALVM
MQGSFKQSSLWSVLLTTWICVDRLLAIPAQGLLHFPPLLHLSNLLQYLHQEGIVPLEQLLEELQLVQPYCLLPLH